MSSCKMSRCVQCTSGAGAVFFQQFKNGPNSLPPVCETVSKGGMGNSMEFGEIRRKIFMMCLSLITAVGVFY